MLVVMIGMNLKIILWLKIQYWGCDVSWEEFNFDIDKDDRNNAVIKLKEFSSIDLLKIREI